MKEREFILYKTEIYKRGKGKMPETKTLYLTEYSYNVDYSHDLNEACRFYSLSEAKKEAYLLDMKVGELKLVVLPLSAGEVNE